ncbi:MAG: hypothetical protein A3H91_10305 [Gammaproteobacteria bacterium RIFCSPLOWO2_02_FULL_61_13]|nr:MAG: hypothetical protein A3H91_10305 [Gammaproteobacteria bacterium RIFCSPLOWO2_02_FULL_61_13]
MTREALFGVFAVVWVSLSLANLLFHKRASVEARRKWHAWIDLGLGVLFAAFGTYWSWGVEPWFIALIWAGCLGMTYLYWRNVQFCLRCSATVWPAGLGRASECPKCKAALHEQTAA